MARKKFISFLGTTFYLECSYYLQDPEEEFYPTRFVQISLLRYLYRKQMLDEHSELIFLMTDPARTRNWQDYLWSGKEQTPGLRAELVRLQKELQEEGIPFGNIVDVSIPEGRRPHELWDIFIRFSEQIQEEDEIYLDITHSFRSLPMLVLVGLNFQCIAKRASIARIFYGAFESLGPIERAKEIPVEKRHVPVFDLTVFVHLFRWAIAADHFMRTGNALLLAELTRERISPFLRKKERKEEWVSAMEQLSRSLDHFSRDLMTVNGRKISADIVQLKNSLNQAREAVQELPPLQHLIDAMIEPFRDVHDVEDVVHNTNIVIEYCLDHQLIQQAFTFLEENIITYGCMLSGLDYNDSGQRQVLTSAMRIRREKLPEEKWRPFDKISLSEQQQRSFFRSFLKTQNHIYDQIIELRSGVSNYRNKLNHAAFVSSMDSAKRREKTEQFVSSGREFLARFRELLKRYPPPIPEQSI